MKSLAQPHAVVKGSDQNSNPILLTKFFPTSRCLQQLCPRKPLSVSVLPGATCAPDNSDSQLCCQNLASAPRCWRETQRQDFRQMRKKELYCFARQRRVFALKTVSPWERWGGGFRVWGVKNRAADRMRAEASLRCFQSWGSVVWWSSFWNKEDFINIFHLLGGLVLRKNSKILLCMFLEEGPEPCPKAAPRYLFAFFFFF